jgi:hypothetical protein
MGVAYDKGGGVKRWDSPIKGRIEGAAPNYDRIVRAFRLDPMRELFGEAAETGAEVRALRARLRNMARTEGAEQSKDYRRTRRRYSAAKREYASLLRELAKLGEVRPRIEVTGLGGAPMVVQVAFPFAEGDAVDSSHG